MLELWQDAWKSIAGDCMGVVASLMQSNSIYLCSLCERSSGQAPLVRQDPCLCFTLVKRLRASPLRCM